LTWILLLGACVAPAAPVIVYQNVSLQGIQDVFADNPGIVAFGDQVLLAAGPRELSSIETRVTTFGDAVIGDVRLTIYELNPLQNVGTELASRVLPGVTIPANAQQSLVFSGWTLTVPTEFVVMLSIENASSRVVGLEVTDAASVGFSDSSFSWWRDANGFFRQSFPDTPNNYYFVVTTDVGTAGPAVPEPGTALLVLGPILGLAMRRRRE
jgi:hypothetical protein